MDRRHARALLGLPATYTPSDVEGAFRDKARTAHPDRGGDPDDFKALVEGRRTLLSRQAAGGTVVVVDDSHRLTRLLVRFRHRATAKPRRVI